MDITCIQYEGSRPEYIHVQVLENMHKTPYTTGKLQRIHIHLTQLTNGSISRGFLYMIPSFFFQFVTSNPRVMFAYNTKEFKQKGHHANSGVYASMPHHTTHFLLKKHHVHSVLVPEPYGIALCMTYWRCEEEFSDIYNFDNK